MLCYRWGATCEYRLEVAIFEGGGRVRHFGPKFQVEQDVPHQLFFVSQKPDASIFLSHGVRISAKFSFVLLQFVHLRDGQDGFTTGKTALHRMQCSKHWRKGPIFESVFNTSMWIQIHRKIFVDIYNFLQTWRALCTSDSVSYITDMESSVQLW